MIEHENAVTVKDFENTKGQEISGDLDLKRKGVAKLPDYLKVSGSLDIGGTKITKLPENLYVGANMYLNGTEISELPESLHVGGHISHSTPSIFRTDKYTYLTGLRLPIRISADEIFIGDAKGPRKHWVAPEYYKSFFLDSLELKIWEAHKELILLEVKNLQGKALHKKFCSGRYWFKLAASIFLNLWVIYVSIYFFMDKLGY
jgi:hypothetical protein